MIPLIDVTYDIRRDSFGKDPDLVSKTLRNYHRLLWSKDLPNGKRLDLDENLRNQSDAGEFIFASDSIVHTFSLWKRYQWLIKQIPPAEIEEFREIAYTVGATTIFPGNKAKGTMTINGARGLNRKICDRIDLTLECIKRFYQNEESPLSNCFSQYADFFELFCDFRGYVNFFFFQDLVNTDTLEIKFLHPFQDFNQNPLPATIEEYLNYKNNSVSFVQNRNRRMDQWARENT